MTRAFARWRRRLLPFPVTISTRLAARTIFCAGRCRWSSRGRTGFYRSGALAAVRLLAACVRPCRADPVKAYLDGRFSSGRQDAGSGEMGGGRLRRTGRPRHARRRDRSCTRNDRCSDCAKDFTVPDRDGCCCERCAFRLCRRLQPRCMMGAIPLPPIWSKQRRKSRRNFPTGWGGNNDSGTGIADASS